MKRIASPWFTVPVARRNPRLRLFCFPYAGGGASVFRDWPRLLPDEIELVAVQLPGRESRFGEPAVRHLPELIGALVEATATCDDVPFASFGHSLGTLLSCEWALQLQRRGSRTPLYMIVSGRGTPHQARADAQTHRLPEEEFIQMLRAMHGTPEEILRDRETMRALLPALRADFAIAADMPISPPRPLPCGLSVYGGLADADVPRDHLQEWQRYSAQPIRVRMFPGGHFFLHSAQQALLEAVVRDLYAALRASSDTPSFVEHTS